MAAAFLFMTMALMIFGKSLVGYIEAAWENFFSLRNFDDMTWNSLLSRTIGDFKGAALLVGGAVLGAMAIGVLVGLFQTKFLISFKAIKFDLNRINPVQGFKRLFSLRSVFELLKALIKVVIVGYIGYSAFRGEWKKMLSYPMMFPQDAAAHMVSVIFNVVIRSGIALLALAIFDYFFQKWEYEKSLRMTKQEVKEEMKDIEGNPEIKRRQRQMMMEILRSRMMQEVPKATVVITNPTHVAVAIKYDREEDEVPTVVAKGKDKVAEKIKEIAREYNIPIVRNPPLAWELYERVELGEEIPPDLYRAVAEVLVYVYSLRQEV